MPMTQKEMVKFLKNHNFKKVDGGKGSHIKMTKPRLTRPIIIPHGELKKGTERSILKEVFIMLLSYPAIFYFDDEGYPSVPFQVYFPDLDGMTQGESIPDAISMGSEYLGIRLADDFENKKELPKPSNINELSLVNNASFQDDKDFDFIFDQEKSFISMINVDLTEYLGLEEPIKKTLTIPKWADKLGKELHLNFSKTLTDAIIREKLEQ